MQLELEFSLLEKEIKYKEKGEKLNKHWGDWLESLLVETL